MHVGLASAKLLMVAALSVDKWLTIVGGSGVYRDAIVSGFSEGNRSVQAMAVALGASVAVVFVTTDEHHQALTDLAAESDRYVIAVVPDLDLAGYCRVLRHGAAGVVWEDTTIPHLVAVVRAALNHDILLPIEFVKMSMLGELEQNPVFASDLDAVTSEILALMVQGLPLKKLAESLGYSERTVQRRITNLCLKLGAVNISQAIHLAHRRGLIV